MTIKTIAIQQQKYKITTKHAKLYTLSKIQLFSILSRFKKRYYELTHTITAFSDSSPQRLEKLHWVKELQEQKLRCKKCNQILEIGDTVFSKRSNSVISHYDLNCSLDLGFIEIE